MKTSPHRPTKALIDLGAIRYNIQQMGAHIPKDTLKWAVVKANAYGHGAVAVATAIQDDVDGFCVSNIDEAIELRQAGIAKKILILGVSEVESLSLAKEYAITLPTPHYVRFPCWLCPNPHSRICLCYRPLSLPYNRQAIFANAR